MYYHKHGQSAPIESYLFYFFNCYLAYLFKYFYPIKLLTLENQLINLFQVFRRDWVMILSIAIIHVLVSTSDQFLKNVIIGEGERHQIFRDILLMFSDILNIGISICALILTQARNVHHIL